MVLYFLLSVALAAGMIVVSYFLGERHRDRVTGETYESGIMPTGSARIRFDVRYYLVAMFFVIFDLEAVFIIAWAIALREAGWTGYIEILVFIAILVAALIYLWRIGALEWGTPKHVYRAARRREE
jgi:NADH-quinone oxidoreductase subunit A